MRIFSRLLFVFALLGGLAYGSYAFGKYVLSSHLFGPQGSALKGGMEAVSRSTRVAGATTGSTDVKGAPRVDVEVLPADQAGGAPPPPLSLKNREPEVGDTSSRDDNYAAPIPTATPSLALTPLPSDGQRFNDETRPRRRKKRRPRPTPSPETGSTERSDETPLARQQESNPGSDAPAPTREDVPSIEERPSERPAERAPDLAPPVPVTTRETRSEPRSEAAPRRRRERVRRTPAPAPRRESAPARRVPLESPVPRPESGGDSPVPIPE